MTIKLALTGAGIFCGALCAGRAFRKQMAKGRFCFQNRTVVLTGGSRGLGLEMARQLARENARIILIARDPDELRAAVSELTSTGAAITGIPCDIRREQEVRDVFQRIHESFGPVDVLINNAGIMQVGPLEHMAIDDFRDAMDVHFFGPLYTTLAALPPMQRRQSGRIVNIISIAANVPVPHMLPYNSSKYALAGFSESLAVELKKDGIFVTSVFPGPMRTGSPPNALFKGRHREEFTWFALADAIPIFSVDSERAARRIMEACRQGTARLDLGVQTRPAKLLHALCPRLTRNLLSLANKLLPSADPGGSTESHRGWESQSRWAPSWLTRLSDRATLRNNEMIGRQPRSAK
jgi:short-subunit dehydrogenase